MEQESLVFTGEAPAREHYRKSWKWLAFHISDRKHEYSLINRIPFLREQRNWTARKLATLSGLSYNIVWRMNQGGRPKLKDAYRVARAFELTVYEVWGMPTTGHPVSTTGAETLPLLERRGECGWSLDTLAELSGVPTTTISRIERGQEPHLDSAFRIAAVLGVSVYQVWQHET